MLSKISQHLVDAFVLDTLLNYITVRHVRGGICNLQSFSVLGLGAVMRKGTAFRLFWGGGRGNRMLLCSERMLFILFTYSYFKF